MTRASWSPIVVLALSGAAGAAWAQDAPDPAKDPSVLHFDVSNLDRTADPCVDFYQFACGGWRARNPIPSDQSRWSRFSVLAEQNRATLHDILEAAARPA